MPLSKVKGQKMKPFDEYAALHQDAPVVTKDGNPVKQLQMITIYGVRLLCGIEMSKDSYLPLGHQPMLRQWSLDENTGNIQGPLNMRKARDELFMAPTTKVKHCIRYRGPSGAWVLVPLIFDSKYDAELLRKNDYPSGVLFPIEVED